jgi:hypothetical protein
VVGNADCESFSGCATAGWCYAVNGKCGAYPEGADDHCSSTEACLKEARCTATATGECVTSGRLDCLRSGLCAAYGSCHWIDARCQARSPGDCGSCLLDGRCRVEGGRCVGTPRDCQRSQHCLDEGHCSPLNGICQALTANDCKDSHRCKVHGACKARAGLCVH